MPRNGRWSNSNSQKTHGDLVERKSIMAPSKGNDFFRPSSWFSRTREGGEEKHTHTHTHTPTLDKSGLCTQQREVLKESTLTSPLFKSFIPSITHSDRGGCSIFYSNWTTFNAVKLWNKTRGETAIWQLLMYLMQKLFCEELKLKASQQLWGNNTWNQNQNKDWHYKEW